MLKNIKRKDKRKLEIQNNIKENNKSWLYSSFGSSKIFDTKMIKAIFNSPQYTEVGTENSNYNFAIWSEMQSYEQNSKVLNITKSLSSTIELDHNKTPKESINISFVKLVNDFVDKFTESSIDSPVKIPEKK